MDVLSATPHRLERFRNKLFNTPPQWRDYNVTIVALGDSVTQGLTVNPRMLGEAVYHSVVRRELARRFPERAFSSINAGVGGDSTDGALQRLQKDVINRSPDLVFVCFGLNDCGRKDAGLDLFENNLTEIVRRLRAEAIDIILMTPNMMASRPNEKVDPHYAQCIGDFVRIQNEGILDRYVDRIRAVAEKTGTPLADAYADWKRREAGGEDMTRHLENGLNHPDAEGHRLFADRLLDVILDCITMDPASPVVGGKTQ